MEVPNGFCVLTEMNRADKLQGVVLAGGKSSRFGTDKALALFDGQTLLERAVELLASLGLSVCVITQKSRDYSFLTCPIYHDLIFQKGPLGGLYTACDLFPENSLLVLTCDMPFLNQKILKQLIEQDDESGLATIFSLDEKLQPFPGLYHASLKNQIESCLNSHHFSMKEFLSGIFQKRVILFKTDKECFRNVNRPEDLVFSRSSAL